jgi:SanA protein
MEIKQKNMPWIKYLIGFCLLIILFILTINIIITRLSHDYIYQNNNEIPKCYTAIVLGAQVSKSGYLSDFLQDRMDVAIALYKANKIN